MSCGRAAHEASQRLHDMQQQAQRAMLAARQATARLRGREEEVGLPELQELAKARLKLWQARLPDQPTSKKFEASASTLKNLPDIFNAVTSSSP